MSSKKTKYIVLANQKGGSAKSSNIINLAGAALFSGKSNVCVLDTDPQKSLDSWCNNWRSESNKRYDYVLPQVICCPNKSMPSQVLSILEEDESFTSDQIWIDTAGFLGFEEDIPVKYIKDILNHVDAIVVPLKSSRLDVESTASTIKFIDQYLSDIDRDIPRLLLRSDIQGGAKNAEYLLKLLNPILAENPKWKCLDTFIPSSRVFSKALENGGNAFTPRKISNISDASISAYNEIMCELGEERVEDSRTRIANAIKNIKTTRDTAKKELEADEQQEAVQS